MKIYRYMSKKELNAFVLGLTLENKTDYSKKCKTNSVGFCFLGENTIVHGHPYTAIECYSFLDGIVDEGILAEFEVAENAVNESWGVYADPENDGYFDTITIKEYCTTEYSERNFKLVRYAFAERDTERCWEVNWDWREV